MKAYRITMTMPDGSQGMHEGLYASSWDAVQATKSHFPDLQRVSAQPMFLQQAIQQATQHISVGQLALVLGQRERDARGVRA